MYRVDPTNHNELLFLINCIKVRALTTAKAMTFIIYENHDMDKDKLEIKRIVLLMVNIVL